MVDLPLSAFRNRFSAAECGKSVTRPGTRGATSVRSEKLGEVAVEFEQIHNIERARQVGSVHTIIPAVDMRPYLIDAVARGMARTGGPAVNTAD